MDKVFTVFVFSEMELAQHLWDRPSAALAGFKCCFLLSSAPFPFLLSHQGSATCKFLERIPEVLGWDFCLVERSG